jgi:hypothetical protein
VTGFVRTADGGVEARLGRVEVEVLATLPTQLRALLGLEGGEVRDRLFPRAYLDHAEEEAEEEWQRLMHDDLLAGKLAALGVVEETIARVGGEVASEGEGEVEVVTLALSEEEALSWMGALNDVRLALGIMLDVDEETDPAAVPADDPRAPGMHLYGWLTWLQGTLIEALDA